MGFFKKVKTIMHFQQYGGTLSFQQKVTKRTHTFVITPKMFKPLHKMLKSGNKYVALIGSKHEVNLFLTLDEVAQYLEKDFVEFEEVYEGNPTHVVLNRKVFLKYMENAIFQTMPASELDDEPENSDKQPVHQPKKVKNAYFDWYEHFLEGKRIHRNIDDAEAYADAMELKHRKKYR